MSTPVSTPAPPGAQAPGRILRAAPARQPQSGPDLELAVQLDGPMTALELRLFTRAFALAATCRAEGAFGPGWNRVRFHPSALANGLFFFQVRPPGEGSKPVTGSVLILR